MKTFTCIKDFESIKDSCLFCQQPLVFVLTNWFGVTKPGLPLINSAVKDNHFKFKFKYNSPSANINTEGCLNALTNVLEFKDPAKFPLSINNPIVTMVNILEGLLPHVELQCNNRKCKMNYYMSGGPFTFDVDSEVKARPFHLMMECFTIKNLWVQNNFVDETTMITMIDGAARTDKSVAVPKLNFDNLSKEKIINKVKTVVTFS